MLDSILSLGITSIFTDMIHMAYLVANRDEYSILGIEKRKQIFYSIF